MQNLHSRSGDVQLHWKKQKTHNPPFRKWGEISHLGSLVVCLPHSGRHANDFSQVGRIGSKVGETEFLHHVVV